MMTVVAGLFSLQEAKQHLSVDHEDDDGLIQIYADAAVSAALEYVSRPAVPDDPRAIAAFRAAALLLLGDLYAHRETGQVGSVSSPINVTASARFLLNPWRLLSV